MNTSDRANCRRSNESHTYPITLASPTANARPHNNTHHHYWVGDGARETPTLAVGHDGRLKMDHASTRCLQRSGPSCTRPCRRGTIKDAIGFKRFRVCTAAIITACNDLQSDQSPNRPRRQDLVSRFTHEARSACVDCRRFVVAAPTSFAPSMPRPLHIAMTQVARAVESLSIIETKAPDVVVCLSRS